MFALLISASAYANNNANIQGVAFGTNYETALAGIKSQFGTPLSANKRQIVYRREVRQGNIQLPNRQPWQHLFQ